MSEGALLKVEHLTVTLQTARGPAVALRDLSLTLERGRMLGVVGESGSGKTMLALALMGLLPEGARVAGRIGFGALDLARLSEPELCRIRGNRVAMIFQEPMTALNPLHTIGRQIAEPLRLHGGLGGSAARSEALRLMDRVRLPQAARRLDAYPHQLSGGQRQRAMIALALACRPDLLIADEPTTALDVTVQSQILDLLVELAEEDGMAMILVSHDLGVIAETVDDVVVMYGGTIVERAPVASLFEARAHPYTRGLFAARPRLDGERTNRLYTIPGTVPDLADLPPGCRFAGRCDFARPDCNDRPPADVALGPGHRAACIRLDAVSAAAAGP